MTCQSDVGTLRRVLLRHARDAFVSPEHVEAQWRDLGYAAAPDFDRACREYDAFAALFESLGVGVEWADGDGLGLDSMYVRDAAVLTDGGAILSRMGKAQRGGEPPLMGRTLNRLGFPTLGEIGAPGTLEGGDVAWLDAHTLAVGRGYRTNRSGIDALGALLPDIEVVEVPLPHWRGPADVFHLMSILSPLASDLLLVYAPLLPVPFREQLVSRGFSFVEVPDEEFEGQGCNVLAVAPRVAVALEGNPETRRRMEAAGVEVHGYEGVEISLKGQGGPTCLTRPLERG